MDYENVRSFHGLGHYRPLSSSHTAELIAAHIRQSALSLFAVTAAALALAPARALASDPPQTVAATASISNLQAFPDSTGAVATFSVNGRIDTNNAFFQSLGTNERSCATCHVAGQSFSMSAAAVRERFARTRGSDPLFAPVDGANCSNARRSDASAHSLLLGNGLIRVAEAIPNNAEFAISVVQDPYGCALVSDAKTGQLVASVYRRPLPSTNVSVLSAVMWDGRETISPLTDGPTFLANLRSNLAHQAMDATLGHAEATASPTSRQLREIADFQIGLFTAQISDNSAGALDRGGATAGPRNLSNQVYYPGINDSLGADPTGTPFTSKAMSSFAAWLGGTSVTAAEVDTSIQLSEQGLSASTQTTRDPAAARRDIAAGEQLFNTAPLTITAVRGLNDNAALGKPASISGTCTTCHDAPAFGHHSLPLPLDIGAGHTPVSGLESDAQISAALAKMANPKLPVFEISGCATPFSNGEKVSFYTTDPGRALVTGLCSDLNRLKGPILRGLAARAPYFHNGAAANLLQVVNFYDQRFGMKLTDQQKRQLVAFLSSL
jgi:cytochrome c peroxidase